MYLSERIPISSYASVYEIYPAIRKTVSLQCISHFRLTSCLIPRNSPPLDHFCYISAQNNISKQKFTEDDARRVKLTANGIAQLWDARD